MDHAFFLMGQYWCCFSLFVLPHIVTYAGLQFESFCLKPPEDLDYKPKMQCLVTLILNIPVIWRFQDNLSVPWIHFIPEIDNVNHNNYNRDNDITAIIGRR